MRGLKFANVYQCRVIMLVAPFTGAWIEISKKTSFQGAASVAPFTGAWIEIFEMAALDAMHSVAPFTGAWIEMTEWGGRPSASVTSHPSRVRGLK